MSADVRYLTKEEVLAIHELVIERYGGTRGLRDPGLLESALAQAGQSFAGADLCPSLAEKAARSAWGIIKNHPFVDGNKRTGTAVLGVFLRANGATFEPDAQELYRIVLSLADGSKDCDDLAEWVRGEIGE